MINVYTKTQEEIAKQDSDYARGAAMAGRGARKFSVCPTYLMKKDGTKVDTRDLTEQDMMTLISLDLQDYANPQGTYKSQGRTDLDAFKLLETVKGQNKFSLGSIAQLLQMEDVYGHIVMDLMGSIDGNEALGKARTIASFNKESNGDFSPVDKQDLIAVIQQMQANKIAKSNATSMKR